MGKNGDPQTGWIGGGSLRQTGCSFQVDKFQQLSTNQGLINPQHACAEGYSSR